MEPQNPPREMRIWADGIGWTVITVREQAVAQSAAVQRAIQGAAAQSRYLRWSPGDPRQPRVPDRVVERDELRTRLRIEKMRAVEAWLWRHAS